MPIQSVIGKYIDLKKSGATYEGLCPFHADKKLGSFKVNPNKNRWNCYTCNIYGDATDFVARLEGVPAREAVFRIAVAENLVSASEAQDLRGGRAIKARPVKKTEKIEENKPRSAAHCASVYKSFVRACPPLSEEHKTQLREVRQIPEKDMSLFFEWPSSADKAFWGHFEQCLYEEGVFTSSVEAIRNVPGFAYDLESDHPYFMNGKGIGIQLFDANGVLRGLQLRQDSAKTGSRYKLFSSGWAAMNRDDEPNKFDGASAGQVPDIVRSDKPVRGIAITEGKFKALSLRRFGYITLSVNGVNSWANVLPEIVCVAKENGINEIHIYFDADMKDKKGVAGAALSLAHAILNSGLTPFFITWDINLGKGIDDMLFAGHKNALVKRALPEMEKELRQKF